MQSPWRVDKVSVEVVGQPIRLQGQYEDVETGFFYNRFRYYDPTLGGYSSSDPLGHLAGENTYGLGLNTLGWADPLGLSCVEIKVERGPAGNPLRAKARITLENVLSKAGTSTNSSSRAFARKIGDIKDDAGHIIAKILGGSGRKSDVFPQLSAVNRGAYRDFEKRIKDYVIQNGAVNVDIRFITNVSKTRARQVLYNVLDDDGNLIFRNIFHN
jgi:RHS repeat-associated protein